VEFGPCDWRQVNRFVVDYLRRDGLLVIRLISKNVSELTAAELLCALWNRHGATLSVDSTTATADWKYGRTGRRKKQLSSTARRNNGANKTLHPASAANEDDTDHPVSLSPSRGVARN